MVDIKTQIDGLTEVEAKAALTMNGGYIPLCPEMYKGDKGQMGVRPLPCVRDEHGKISTQTIKSLFMKINEELDELKEAVIMASGGLHEPVRVAPETRGGFNVKIAEEAADVITSITTLLEALGIDADARDEAQRQVNRKNRERRRL